MKEDRFFLLESEDKKVGLSIHFKRVEIGKIAVIDINGGKSAPYEILLTDSTGENVYDRITETPVVISLGKEFKIDGRILLDLFSGGVPLIAASLDDDGESAYHETKIDITSASDEEGNGDIFSEAGRVLEKVRTGGFNYIKEDEKSSIIDNILKDFEYLYSKGRKDARLAFRFNESEWAKLDLAGKCHYLGKTYADGKLSSIIIAMPKLNSAAGKLELGAQAEFIKATIYDDFGYLVLALDATSGKAIKVN